MTYDITSAMEGKKMYETLPRGAKLLFFFLECPF